MGTRECGPTRSSDVMQVLARYSIEAIEGVYGIDRYTGAKMELLSELMGGIARREISFRPVVRPLQFLRPEENKDFFTAITLCPDKKPLHPRLGIPKRLLILRVGGKGREEAKAIFDEDPSNSPFLQWPLFRRLRKASLSLKFSVQSAALDDNLTEREGAVKQHPGLIFDWAKGDRVAKIGFWIREEGLEEEKKKLEKLRNPQVRLEDFLCMYRDLLTLAGIIENRRLQLAEKR